MTNRRDFAPSDEAIRAGVSWVLAGLALPLFSRLHTRVRARTRNRVLEGAPSRLLAADLTALLAGRGWRWPAMEKWATQFDRAEVWPLFWTQLEIASPLRWTDIPSQTKFAFLADNLMHAVYAHHRMEQLLDPDVMSLREPRLVVGDDRCLADRLVIEVLGNSAIRNGRPVRVPVYPGSDIRWISEARKR